MVSCKFSLLAAELNNKIYTFYQFNQTEMKYETFPTKYLLEQSFYDMIMRALFKIIKYKRLDLNLRHKIFTENLIVQSGRN